MKKLLPPLKTYGGCTGTGEDFCTQTRSDIEPLFLEYGVDMYFAGHEHNYESLVTQCRMPQASLSSFPMPDVPILFAERIAGSWLPVGWVDIVL